eukprot:5076214-Alexandrium_andersonii.AAC.1
MPLCSRRYLLCFAEMRPGHATGPSGRSTARRVKLLLRATQLLQGVPSQTSPWGAMQSKETRRIATPLDCKMS